MYNLNVCLNGCKVTKKNSSACKNLRNNHSIASVLYPYTMQYARFFCVIKRICARK